MSCTKVRDPVHLKWRRHLRELGDDQRSSIQEAFRETSDLIDPQRLF
jgi:hypothetical protein